MFHSPWPRSQDATPGRPFCSRSFHRAQLPTCRMFFPGAVPRNALRDPFSESAEVESERPTWILAGHVNTKRVSTLPNFLIPPAILQWSPLLHAGIIPSRLPQNSFETLAIGNFGRSFPGFSSSCTAGFSSWPFSARLWPS